MTADTLGSTISSGVEPADNTNRQFWTNLAPKAFRNIETASADAYYKDLQVSPVTAPDPFARMFYLAVAPSLFEAYHERTVGNFTGGLDVREGDFFAFYVGSDFTTASEGKENIYFDHGGRLPQSVDVANLEDATGYVDGAYTYRYIGFSGIVTGSDLPASAVMRFGIGCDGGSTSDQNLRVGMPTVLWIPAGSMSNASPVPYPTDSQGVFATKYPANITFDTNGLGTVGAVGSDFPALATNLVVAGIGDSWANGFENNTGGVNDGYPVTEWMDYFGINTTAFSETGMTFYGDARAGRTLADMDTIVDEILEMDPVSTRADTAGFGSRGTYNRLLPNVLLLQGGSFNSLIVDGQTPAQMKASVASIVAKVKAAAQPVHLYLGNMSGAMDSIFTDFTAQQQADFLEFNADLITDYQGDADVTLVFHNQFPVNSGAPNYKILNQSPTDPGHPDLVGGDLVFNSYHRYLFLSGAPILNIPYPNNIITLGASLNINVPSNWFGATSYEAINLPVGTSFDGTTITGAPTQSGAFSIQINAIGTLGTSNGTIKVQVNALPINVSDQEVITLTTGQSAVSHVRGAAQVSGTSSDSSGTITQFQYLLPDGNTIAQGGTRGGFYQDFDCTANTGAGESKTSTSDVSEFEYAGTGTATIVVKPEIITTSDH